MYVGVQDYGTALFISWILSVDAPFYKRKAAYAFEMEDNKKLTFDLDVFQLEELKAFTMACHRLLVQEVKNILEETEVEGDIDVGVNAGASGFYQK